MVVLSRIMTAVETLAGTVASSISSVVITAGSAVIGKLGANSGVDIGDVDVTSVSVPAAVKNGKKVVATPGTQLALGTTSALVIGVTVKAEASNTGIIYVGKSTVSSADGYELAAGEQVFIPIDDIAAVFIDASIATDGATWIAN